MSCGVTAKFRSPYISDPFAAAQAALLCVGLCNINATSCVADYALADCAVADNIPENFPVNI